MNDWWQQLSELTRELGRAASQAEAAAPAPVRATPVADPVSITQHLVRAGLELSVIVLGAIALVWLIRLLHFITRVLPIPARLRDALLRVAPIVEVTVALAYAAAGLAVLVVDEPAFAAILMSLVAVLVVFAWPALYDLMSGVAFRVSQPCRVGDHVELEDIEGRVIEIGTRAMVVQTRQGDEAVIPYGRVGRRTLRRTQSVSGAHVHAFVLDEQVGEDFAEIKQAVIRAAVRCHWGSVVHEPKVERRAGTKIEVSVYALDSDHAPLVEAAVRKGLRERARGGGSLARETSTARKAEPAKPVTAAAPSKARPAASPAKPTPPKLSLGKPAKSGS